MVAIDKQKTIGLILVCTLLLCLTIAVSLLYFQQSAELFRVSFQKESEIQEIKLWKDAQGSYYLFLPGYVEMADIRVILKTESEIYVNGQKLHSEFSFGDFLLDTSYGIEYSQFGVKHESQITFVRSGGVASMFLKTQSGSMEYIHKDKNNKESGIVSLYTADGALNYCGAAESVSGRGNYTWENSDKKPYNIILAEEADLLNMGIGSKWVLLANSSDSTLMRNKIVYDFASKIGLSYTPESRYVDLYLNGEYRGLYLMCEAVEIGVDRVAISQIDGAILTVETENAFQGKKANYFVTESNVAVEVKSPKNVTNDQLLRLKAKVQAVENAILSKDGFDAVSGMSWKELVDVPSWVKKYLVDEVFANHDALMRSANYYYQDDSSKLYAGPVWDYDLAIGNESSWQLQSPQSFWANRLTSQPDVEMPWFYELYQKEEFYQGMVETYKTVFLPELDNLMNVIIPSYAQEISTSATADKIRWNADAELLENVEWLSTYIEQRIEFLNDVWFKQRDYCVVRAVQGWGGYYAYNVVFKGEKLATLPAFEDTETATFAGWYDQKTGEPFDISKPIVEDMEIYAKWVDKPSSLIKQMLKLAPLVVITVLGMLLVAGELYRWRKTR